MKRCLVFLVVMLSITAAFLSSCERREVTGKEVPEVLWKAKFIPCIPQTCGGFPQNIATLRLLDGEVVVTPDGLVTIKLRGLAYATGGVASGKTLDVLVGSFASGQWEANPINPLGTITTDEQGNFEGAIRAITGAPFAIAPRTAISGQFVLNEPGVRSEFVTGFVVPEQNSAATAKPER